MNENIKKFLLGLFILILVALLVVFKPNTYETLAVKDSAIIHETKSGGVYIKITKEDFDKIGFAYGDSVNIKFSNGYEILDLPYYKGSYTFVSEPLLVSASDSDYLKVFVKYADDLWVTAKLNDADTATITLNEKGKYLKIQNAKDIYYTDTQGDIPDIVFANFRNVNVGKIKENILYRSASPINNSHKRASTVDKLIKEANINYVIDLSDNESDLLKHINKSDFNSPYFLSLYNDKKVLALSISNMDFKGQNFKDRLVKGLNYMSDNPGPYLIHCVEGKDRTGFVLLVIESLLDATYEEMVDDYMLTYKNYYNITKDTDIDRYETIKEINIDYMLHYIIGDENNKKDLSKITNYSNYTRKYLLSLGMTEKNIDKLIEVLSKK